ncbi:MAG TPA: hypothetical protein VKX96_00180, partial [Chloroflexota bacterium]|nr:hypothetical protein [Chloroflexota bacterium]
KQHAYKPLLALPMATGLTGTFGKAPMELKVLYHQNNDNGQPGRVSFAFRIFDDGPSPIDLSRLALRYWLSANSSNLPPGSLSVDSGQLGGVPLPADVKSTPRGDYLEIRFPPSAGTVERYRATAPVTVRFQESATLGVIAPSDYSFSTATLQPDQYQEWNRVTLYLDGKLVWGREPGGK